MRIWTSFITIKFPWNINNCLGSRGRLVQWKNVCFVKRFLLQTVVRISPYAKFLSCAIYLQMHNPEAPKNVRKNHATSQSESKNLPLSNTQPLSEREHSPYKLVLWYACAHDQAISYILLCNSTQPGLQPIEVLSAIRLFWLFQKIVNFVVK